MLNDLADFEQGFTGTAYFQTLARYNRWANERLYAVCLSLSVEDYRKDRGAFFGSIGHTLNHILVGDRIWMARFAGLPNPALSLDAVPYPDRNDLWRARQAQDEEIAALFKSRDDTLLTQHFSYLDTKGCPKSLPVPVAFGHFFNHQTHHRGQVHHMLTHAGLDAPPLDLSYFYFENV